MINKAIRLKVGQTILCPTLLFMDRRYAIGWILEE